METAPLGSERALLESARLSGDAMCSLRTFSAHPFLAATRRFRTKCIAGNTV
jgi:hypothetical protein